MANQISEEEFRKRNVQKYGQKDFDLISDMYRQSNETGHAWAVGNSIKYLKRFISKSTKAYNLIDLKKAKDYLERAIEMAEKQEDINKQEIIEK